LIGFGAVTRLDDRGALIEWPSTLDYGDGSPCLASTDDPTFPQGPVWFAYLASPERGDMELMDEVVQPDPSNPEKVRVPVGFRAPFECPSIGATRFHLMNGYELVRVWKAPKDGTVTVRGVARHASGTDPATVRIARIHHEPVRSLSSRSESASWTLLSGTVSEATVGGRPAVQLELALSQDALRAFLHVQAHPGTSVMRQWVELENASSSSFTLNAPSPFTFTYNDPQSSPLTHHTLCGGTSRPNQGQLESAEVGETYHRTVLGEKTDNYVPWTALVRNSAPNDGLFIALDHLGTWTLTVDRAGSDAALSAGLPAWTGLTLSPNQKLTMPLATFGVFNGDLDDMGRRVYDWQYEYLWDYTNPDYYAKTKWAVAWFFCSRNLQEQFTARLAGLDMDADLMRTLGIEMLWDDAGWSKYPSWPIPDSYAVVFSPTFEGPDFAETLRYLDKMNMKWLVWTAGRPAGGIMDTKAGSWGDFQWRTDGVGRLGLAEEQAFRQRVERFLTVNPGCSFHTCDGGSRYAHQFEIQRFADVNYLSDMGRGPQTTHYLSYLEPPDKWLDLIDVLTQGAKYNPEIMLGQLSFVPGWYARADEPDHEAIRRMMEIYRYLRSQGVAGRWSYMMHPRVEGDEDFYYDQRLNHDKTKSCVILKHTPKPGATFYPVGLQPDREYAVGFESKRQSFLSTGADLMASGIALKEPTPGELVYLGLPNRPGSGSDHTPPAAPGQAYFRRETNIGHSGIGIHWSPGIDDNWISYYLVQRGDTVIGKASVGTYYFDHSPGWDSGAAYSVRTVDGDGNLSDWTSAQPLPGGEDTFAALGGHFAEAGRDGWSAETSTDGISFAPMTFVAPAKSPAGDFGGTPNQPGGVEGYWEGPDNARVGRGWQQASPSVACVRTWTAPKSGTIRVVGRAMREIYRQSMGESLRVHILHNVTRVWPQEDWAQVPVNNLTGASHDLSFDVAAGDTLRFVLDHGTSPDTDIVAWMPRITYLASESPRDSSVVRIRCGTSQSYTDTTGNVWSEDKYFTGGDAVSSVRAIQGTLPATGDYPLYQSGRQGIDFSYAIPVKPGLYTARIKLAETQFDWSFQRPINVHINGRVLLENFDVCHAAKGPGRACDRVFRNLAPNADGQLVLRFTGGFEPSQETGEALVHAIEILPETNPTVRINCGSTVPFIDWNSYIWSADPSESASLHSDAPVAQASPTLYDQTLYQSARTGKTLVYTVPAPPGVYSVHLKFAELWLTETGQRPMSIEVNGFPIRDNWDPAQAAGQIGMAADIRTQAITPDSNGNITIRITATGANDAIIQGIEIE
ncbi:MAG: malectin, partial [Candidatus Hydrogenedentes bacterium]|nr:malectin [Candidatus Hydrogenedentota bacterium]